VEFWRFYRLRLATGMSVAIGWGHARPLSRRAV
jgi:hypothetical protein